MNRIAALVCIVIALGLLYPGITQPVLTLSGAVEKADIAQLGIDLMVGDEGNARARAMLSSMSTMLGLNEVEGQITVYNSTRSIWGTVNSLLSSGNVLVAFLIAFFSVVVPVIKLLMQGAGLLLPASPIQQWLLSTNAALSKWSMADVFVMGLLVAFMAGGAADQMGQLLITEAQLGAGFYYFLAYCVFSIAVGGLMRHVGRET